MYRLVKGPTITRADFDPPCRLDPKRKSTDMCGLCGTSVYTSLAAARRTAERYKKLPKEVAVGRLGPHHGLTLVDPDDPEHFDWWIPEGVDPSTDFQMVA